MRRIVVLGTSGSGKTTLSRVLAPRLGVPHIELDALHNGPNWTIPSPEDFRAMVIPLLDQDGWVVDGGFGRKLGEIVIRAADTIIWLDLPLPHTMSRLFRRTVKLLVLRTELWNGNRQTVRGAFALFAWAIKRHAGLRRELPPVLAGPICAEKTVRHLRSQRAIDELIATFEASGQ